MKKQKQKTAKKSTGLAPGMQPTREISKSKLRRNDSEESDKYSPMETGSPDQDDVADARNPQGVQGGRGPLNQEGEGDRQNDQLAELEEIEPEEK